MKCHTYREAAQVNNAFSPAHWNMVSRIIHRAIQPADGRRVDGVVRQQQTKAGEIRDRRPRPAPCRFFRPETGVQGG